MSEQVKQEGEFKIKTPKKPKNLGKIDNVTKVDIPNTAPEAQGEVVPEVTKVEIKKEDNAVSEPKTDELVENKQTGDIPEVEEQVQEPSANVELPIQEITEEQVQEETKKVEQEVKEAIRDNQVAGKALPENIEKLVSFMEDTGGNIEDYVRLNADYSSVDNTTLIREYYKQTKPHLDHEDVSLLLEDFDYDEEVDEPKEIRKKKIAFKEEVAKAQGFLENAKSKYYDEIKLRPGVTQEQQKAMDFFNRYNEEKDIANRQHEDFKHNTKNLFGAEFKGFDFKLGQKIFRYNVKNPNAVADRQSNVANTIEKFLDKEGNVVDVTGYHKAIYAAENADTIASHFYEQGKADAVRDMMAKSKNIDQEPRKTASGEVFVNGIKVKALSGVDSSKLKIKKVTIKN
tara:strand:- start:20077 stop:21276 length:1200 start_codon:yes stop_codon:yes gene_type:complete